MVTRASPDLAEVIANGRWLAHRYDEIADAFRFRFVDREAHRAATFLTDAELGPGEELAFDRRAVAAALAERRDPAPQFIFHSAYCCSTLLTRAFDLPGAAMGVSEPVLLNDMIGLTLRGGEPKRVLGLTDLSLQLLARPLALGERAVIKPSNVVNPLLRAILDLSPQSRAVLLHAPLDAFLGSVARKEVEGRAWVRDLMWKLITLGHAQRFGFTEEELYRHTDLQVAALGWLAQQALFGEAIGRYPARLTAFDSDTLTAHPAAVMTALGQSFDIALDGASVAAGPAFTRHSKEGHAFSAVERANDRAEGLAIHAREIAMVSTWAQQVADYAGIAVKLSDFVAA